MKTKNKIGNFASGSADDDRIIDDEFENLYCSFENESASFRYVSNHIKTAKNKKITSYNKEN